MTTVRGRLAASRAVSTSTRSFPSSSQGGLVGSQGSLLYLRFIDVLQLCLALNGVRRMAIIGGLATSRAVGAASVPLAASSEGLHGSSCGLLDLDLLHLAGLFLDVDGMRGMAAIWRFAAGRTMTAASVTFASSSEGIHGTGNDSPLLYYDTVDWDRLLVDVTRVRRVATIGRFAASRTMGAASITFASSSEFGSLFFKWRDVALLAVGASTRRRSTSSRLRAEGWLLMVIASAEVFLSSADVRIRRERGCAASRAMTASTAQEGFPFADLTSSVSSSISWCTIALAASGTLGAVLDGRVSLRCWRPLVDVCV